MAIIQSASGVKGRTFELLVLNRWVFNFYVCSILPQGKDLACIPRLRKSQVWCEEEVVILSTAKFISGRTNPVLSQHKLFSNVKQQPSHVYKLGPNTNATRESPQQVRKATLPTGGGGCFFPRVRGFWENVRQFVPRLRFF